MRAPEHFSRIVNRIRYDVSKATLIAGDDYWDGHNWERSGTNEFLYRTQKGRFFRVCLTQWQGSRDTLEPVSEDEAIELYENSLSEHYVDYEKAFPGILVEEA
jgi:hypothetical protein